MQTYHRRAALCAVTVLAVGAALAAASIPASAQIFGASSTNINGTGLPVEVEATFTVSAGQVDILLQNLQPNPTSVVQNLSDLFFTVSSGLNSGTLGTSSGQEVSIDKNGVPTLGGTVSTGWGLDAFDTTLGFHLNDLGHAGPAHTIIGPPGATGNYTNANGSIAGNKPHNPFLNQSATFTVDITGLAATDTVTSATFSFGTVAGINLMGGGGPPQSVPEPGNYAMLAGILVPGIGFLIRRRRA